MSKPSRERDLVRCDAIVDREGAALRDIAIADLDAWQELMDYLKRCQATAPTDDIHLAMRLAVYGGQIVTGRILNRDI